MKLSTGTVLPFFADAENSRVHGAEPGLPPLYTLAAGEPTSGQYTGIKALMLAVLEEAIRNYLGPDARLYRDAAYWIACNGHRSPFAFGTVCETLGLEPGAVRSALEERRAQDGFGREIVRSRPNVRHSGRLLMRKNRSRPTAVNAAARADQTATR